MVAYDYALFDLSNPFAHFTKEPQIKLSLTGNYIIDGVILLVYQPIKSRSRWPLQVYVRMESRGISKDAVCIEMKSTDFEELISFNENNAQPAVNALYELVFKFTESFDIPHEHNDIYINGKYYEYKKQEGEKIMNIEEKNYEEAMARISGDSKIESSAKIVMPNANIKSSKKKHKKESKSSKKATKKAMMKVKKHNKKTERKLVKYLIRYIDDAQNIFYIGLAAYMKSDKKQPPLDIVIKLNTANIRLINMRMELIDKFELPYNNKKPTPIPPSTNEILSMLPRYPVIERYFTEFAALMCLFTGDESADLFASIMSSYEFINTKMIVDKLEPMINN